MWPCPVTLTGVTGRKYHLEVRQFPEHIHRAVTASCYAYLGFPPPVPGASMEDVMIAIETAEEDTRFALVELINECSADGPPEPLVTWEDIAPDFPGDRAVAAVAAAAATSVRGRLEHLEMVARMAGASPSPTEEGETS